MSFVYFELIIFILFAMLALDLEIGFEMRTLLNKCNRNFGQAASLLITKIQRTMPVVYEWATSVVNTVDLTGCSAS